jgi:hypothetical protein
VDAAKPPWTQAQADVEPANEVLPAERELQAGEEPYHDPHCYQVVTHGQMLAWMGSQARGQRRVKAQADGIARQPLALRPVVDDATKLPKIASYRAVKDEDALVDAMSANARAEWALSALASEPALAQLSSAKIPAVRLAAFLGGPLAAHVLMPCPF